MFTILEHLRNHYLSQKAQGMTEYALIVALVVAIGIAVFGTGSSGVLGTAITDIFGKISTKLSGLTL